MVASVTTNNSNLREAVNLNMNQAFVQLGGKKQAVIDSGHPLLSRAHTDSAGGEAFCNEDNEDIQDRPIRPI